MQDLPGIYAIINVQTGRRYIGSSINVRKRLLGHRRALQRGIHINEHLPLLNLIKEGVG